MAIFYACGNFSAMWFCALHNFQKSYVRESPCPEQLINPQLTLVTAVREEKSKLTDQILPSVESHYIGLSNDVTKATGSLPGLKMFSYIYITK